MIVIMFVLCINHIRGAYDWISKCFATELLELLMPDNLFFSFYADI